MNADVVNGTEAERSWRGLYLVGAAVAVVTLAGLLFDIGLSMVPGWGPSTTPTEAQAWFAQFSAAPLLGLRNLDLINITLSAVALPMYVALYGAHRRAEPALALTALVIVAAGAVVFLASNAALPMLGLSRRYAEAAVADRPALEAAAAALLVRGAHGSSGAFPGFFLSEVGTLLMALAMLRGEVFGRWAGWLGVSGASALAVYSVVMTFVRGADSMALALAAPGGLLMVAWHVLVARGLLRLSA